jgi:hypothetical protein
MFYLQFLHLFEHISKNMFRLFNVKHLKIFFIVFKLGITFKFQYSQFNAEFRHFECEKMEIGVDNQL